VTVIKIKNSSIAGKEPTAAQLQTAELAVNLTDAKLYTKDAAGNIVALGGSTGSGGTGDRPSSPSVGDLFFDTDLGVLLYWDGSAWQEVAGDIEVPTSQPGTPEDGQLWWNTDDNTLYIWYEDGDTGQWVIAVPQGLGSDFDETVADGLYVKQSGDNMTGDLTLGGDKITLDATDGSASFAGGNFSINPVGGVNNFARYLCKVGPDADADAFVVSNAIGSSRQATWYGNGDLVIGGTINGNGASGDDANITFNRDGSAEFAGDITFTGDTNTIQFGDSGIAPSPAGGMLIRRRIIDGSDAATGNEIVIYNSKETEAAFAIQAAPDAATTKENKIVLNNDGSATFANKVIAGNYLVNDYGLATSSASTGDKATLFAANWGGGWILDLRQSNVSVFHVDNNGNSTFRNAVFELEPDNDAHYTTTTDSEGNETRVYNGPTLDVKERLQNLLARVDAMEANELIDDATDSSLLTLVSNLDTRLSSIEIRLAALEGVS
jgi:hypothetical protein